MSRKILPLNRALKKYTEVEMVAEHRFHPFRERRFDYSIPELKIALEVEGGIWNAGRHVRPDGFRRDMEKYNEAAALGWLLIRVIPNELLSVNTLQLLIRAINVRKGQTNVK